jgi:hypothetical protein
VKKQGGVVRKRVGAENRKRAVAAVEETPSVVEAGMRKTRMKEMALEVNDILRVQMMNII